MFFLTNFEIREAGEGFKWGFGFLFVGSHRITQTRGEIITVHVDIETFFLFNNLLVGSQVVVYYGTIFMTSLPTFFYLPEFVFFFSFSFFLKKNKLWNMNRGILFLLTKTENIYLDKFKSFLFSPKKMSLVLKIVCQKKHV